MVSGALVAGRCIHLSPTRPVYLSHRFVPIPIYPSMIFNEQLARKPDHYPQFRPFIQAFWDNPWNAAKWTFQSDVQDFKTELTEQERAVITRTLSAIGQIEIAVKRFWSRLGDTLKHPSLIDLGMVMAASEVIHGDAYEKLLRVLNLEGVFEDNLKLDVVKGRVDYLRKYNEMVYTENKRRQFVYSLILFTLFIESVSLFSQFYVVLWFNRFRNVLRDTAQQTKYTRAEEITHSLIGIELINTIRRESPGLFDAELESRVYHEAEQAFAAESRIVDWMVGSYTGHFLSSGLLKEYIKDRINQALIQIGFRSIFPVSQSTLDQTRWMDEGLKGNNQADFFHRKPVEYTKNSAAFDEESLFGDSADMSIAVTG